MSVMPLLVLVAVAAGVSSLPTCSYSVQSVLQSGEQITWSRGTGKGGCGAAVVLQMAAGEVAVWRDSTYTVTDVDALPLFYINGVQNINNVRILYRDVALVATSTNATLIDTVVKLNAAHNVSGVSVAFVNVTLVAAAPDAPVVDRVVQVTALTVVSVDMHITGCRFQHFVFSRVFSVSSSRSVAASTWSVVKSMIVFALPAADAADGREPVGVVLHLFGNSSEGLLDVCSNMSASHIEFVGCTHGCAREMHRVSLVYVASDAAVTALLISARNVTARLLVPPTRLLSFVDSVGFVWGVRWGKQHDAADLTVSLVDVDIMVATTHASSVVSVCDTTPCDRLVRGSVRIEDVRTRLHVQLPSDNLDENLLCWAVIVSVTRIRWTINVSLVVTRTTLSATVRDSDGAGAAVPVSSEGTSVTLFLATGDNRNRYLTGLRFVYTNCSVVGGVSGIALKGRADVPGVVVSSFAVSLIVMIAGLLHASVVEAVGCNVTAASAGGVVLPQSVPLVACFIVASVSALSLYTSVENVSISVSSCSATLASVNFNALEGLAVADAVDIVCFGVVNVLTVASLVAVSIGERVMSACPGMPMFDPPVMRHSQVTMEDSTVYNPRLWLHKNTGDAFFTTNSVATNVSIVVRHCEGGNASAPSAVMGCMSCNASDLRVETHALRRVVVLLMFSGLLPAAVTNAHVVDSASAFSQNVPSLPPLRMLERRGGTAVTARSLALHFNRTAVDNVLLSSSGNLVLDATSAAVLECVTYGGVLVNNETKNATLLAQSGSRLQSAAVRCSDPPADVDHVVGSGWALPYDARAASDTALGTMYVVGAVASTFPQVSSVAGLVGPLQVSSASLRLRASCASGDTNATSEADGGSAERERTSDAGTAIDVGDELADNPLQLQIGGVMAAGTVVGNVLFVLAGSLLTAAAALAATQLRSRCSSQAASPPAVDTQQLAADFCAAVVSLYSMVLQPTSAAAVALLLGGSEGLAAIGGLGAAIVAVPVAVAAWMTLCGCRLRAVRRRDSQKRRRQQRRGLLEALVVPEWRWVMPPMAAIGAAERVHWFLLMPLVEPYRGGRQWLAVLELVATVAQGSLFGAAAHAVASRGCDAVDVSLWVMLGVRCGVLACVVVARPYAALLTALQSGVLNVVACAVVLLSALHLDSAAAALNMVEVVTSFASLLVPLVLFVLELAGCVVYRRRYEKTLHGMLRTRVRKTSACSAAGASRLHQRLQHMSALDALSLLVAAAASHQGSRRLPRDRNAHLT